MYIDYQPLHTWHGINRSLSEHFKVHNTRNEIRVYKNVSHALVEVCLGLIKLFNHKTSVYYFKDTSPYLPSLIQKMKMENTQVTALSETSLRDLSSLSTFIQNLQSEDLFLLYFKDDPLLGKKFPVNQLEEMFCQNTSDRKNIFLISVSHFFNPSSFLLQSHSPYNIEIQSLREHGSLAFLGARSRKIEPLVASHLNWQKQDLNSLKKKIDNDFTGINDFSSSTKERILAFEEKRVGNCQSFFSSTEERIYDRAVIYWEDMDGYAFIYELAKELKIELLPPGSEMRLETTSLSRWGEMKSMNWLKVHGLTSQQLRGLVMISSEFINPDLPNMVSQVREKVLKLQEG